MHYEVDSHSRFVFRFCYGAASNLYIWLYICSFNNIVEWCRARVSSIRKIFFTCRCVHAHGGDVGKKQENHSL